MSLFAHVPRYLVVGAICAAIYNVVMIAGAALGVHYVISTLFAFVVIVAVGYGLHCAFTFSERFGWKSLARYSLVMTANIPVNLALMFALHDLAHAPMYVASPAVTVILFAWNYLASRWAILRRPAPAVPHSPEAHP